MPTNAKNYKQNNFLSFLLMNIKLSIQITRWKNYSDIRKGVFDDLPRIFKSIN